MTPQELTDWLEENAEDLYTGQLQFIRANFDNLSAADLEFIKGHGTSEFVARARVKHENLPEKLLRPDEANSGWRPISEAVPCEDVYNPRTRLLWVERSGYALGTIVKFDSGNIHVSPHGHTGDWKVTHFQDLKPPAGLSEPKRR